MRVDVGLTKWPASAVAPVKENCAATVATGTLTANVKSAETIPAANATRLRIVKMIILAKTASVILIKQTARWAKNIWRKKMNNLNSVLVEGNLVRDPNYRETSKGTPLCTFSIASNRYFKQNDEMEKEVSFFDVETWAKLAESCEKLGHKGRGVRVVGRLKQDRWTDNDGKARSKISIVAEHVEFRAEALHKEAETQQDVGYGETEEKEPTKVGFAACF
jgi:single-strand DNA-binding protein